MQCTVSQLYRYITLAVNYCTCNLLHDIVYYTQDGNHFRLQYNESDTWSLKYNLLFEVITQYNCSHNFGDQSAMALKYLSLV